MLRRGPLRPALLALGLLLHLSMASAFCVYNDANSAITAYQMPVSSRSYKAVIQPGESGCCNWSDCGEYSPYGSGRCDPALFCLKFGEDDTDVVTTEQVLAEINSVLFRAVGVVAGAAASVLTANPGIGMLVGFGTGMGLSEADKELQAFMDEMGCQAVVKTYNGGIAYATADGEFGGAWGDGFVDPPAGTEDCPIAGTNPTAALEAQQQEAEAAPAVPSEPVADVGGSCGAGIAICPGSQCCSQYGFCGETDAHCGDGCQSSYGSCN